MQHSAIVEKRGTVVVFAKTSTDMPEIRVWKLSENKEFSELLSTNFVVFKLQDGYYKCRFCNTWWKLLSMYKICRWCCVCKSWKTKGVFATL